MDSELYSILTQRNGFSDLRPLAHALAQHELQRRQDEAEFNQRFDAAKQRRMQQAALSDPALVRLRQQLEAPVEPFSPEAPGSYAPGAASDIGTLGGAFGTPPPSNFRSDPNSRVNVALGDLELLPMTEGAFSAPQTAADRVFAGDMSPGQEASFDRDYAAAEREGNLGPPRKPLPKRSTMPQSQRMEGGITGPRIRSLGGETPRVDLSPEGAALYEKLVPSLVARRNNEESTRRTLEAEQMRGRTSERNAQLRSATDLLRTSMDLAAKAELYRKYKAGSKTKDEALKWADQERDARLQAMNAKLRLVQQYKYALTDENDPEYMAAKRDAAQSVQLYQQAEDEFNTLRSEKGVTPKGKTLKKSGTQSYTLDANGQLVPG